jgi:FixJ family two-component response regulator
MNADVFANGPERTNARTKRPWVGQEALRSRGHRTPIVLITAYPNEKHRIRALNGGAVGFLSKPFDEASLIDCLTVAIKLRELDAEGEIDLRAMATVSDAPR